MTKPKTEIILIPIDTVRKFVAKTIGLEKLSRASIYTYMKTKAFPTPLDFGVPRMWRKHEVEDWLKKQIEGT